AEKALSREAALPETTEARRAAIEKEKKALQREAEGWKAKFQEALAKMQEKQMQVLYGDVQAAARRYAQAHDLDLVLHYNDAVDARDYWSGANLARKMQAGALMPLYAAPGMDISKEVIAALNADLRKKGP